MYVPIKLKMYPDLSTTILKILQKPMVDRDGFQSC